MFGREPALIISGVMAVLALGVAFGVDVTEDQQEAIVKVFTAILGLVGGVAIRSQVVPVSRIEDKGLSAKTLNPVKS
jgi:hypothetical protein